jgi:transcriptional regulator with XRE-family HTH domain
MTSHPQPPGAAPATPARQQAGEEAARRHVSTLRQHGGTYRSIARAAGLATVTVHGLATGRTRPQAATSAMVLAVRPGRIARARVDAGGTRLRLRALHVMGHGSARIARAAGTSERTIRALVRGDAPTIGIRLRDTITEVYDAWWDKRAPERTRAERAAATAARRRAIAGNWCAPAALDDDQLDTPGYWPAFGWKPAAGTGTAADRFPPPVRRPPGGPRTGRPA